MIDRVWRGNDAFARAARTTLIPIEGAYRAAIEVRRWMYDRSLLRVRSSAIPVVSIGNLSVGGTGKTPFAAWLANQLAERRARPAIVLRGYGGDEQLVHTQLNPGIPVIVAKRRAAGIAEAANMGANVAVLDDAFQHRSAERVADVVLLSAEQWQSPIRLLPAGPWREPLSALRRAALVVVTRKTADQSRIDVVTQAIRRVAPDVPQAVVRFDFVELRRAGAGRDQTLPMSALEQRPVVAIAGIAQPSVFFQQLTNRGAIVTEFGFPDHHEYSGADVFGILSTAGGRDALVVCTLKDAVKLGQIWPATAPPLWYVLQGLEIESGGDALENLLSQLTPQSPSED